jgi:hypothetical protein
VATIVFRGGAELRVDEDVDTVKKYLWWADDSEDTEDGWVRLHERGKLRLVDPHAIAFLIPDGEETPSDS